LSRVGILGAGSWGTALALHYARQGQPVTLWARDPETADRLRRERRNERYMGAASLPRSVDVTAELGEIAGLDRVLLVVPSHAARDVIRQLFALRRGSSRHLVVVSAVKGVETESLARMSEVVLAEGAATDREVGFAVLSGPTFAAELVAGQPSAAVIASDDRTLAATLRGELSTPTLRLYSSSDVVGVEIGGAAKNVIAIAAGTVTGSGYGHNTLAALITRGLHEITRLGVACGGQARTFSGLAGLGDLVLTCTGELSRNRQTGILLAEGVAPEEIAGRLKMVAEGVRNALSITRLSRSRGVEMPITEQMGQVIYEGRSVALAVEALMRRELKAEADL
jgi:glycerol-3-phosphate dehydrogenase (NAD(P)+)